MKNVFFILICFLFFVSCGNRPRSNVSEIEMSIVEAVTIQEILDSNLVCGIRELLSGKDHLKYPDIPLGKSYVTVRFRIDPEGRDIYFSDSTVLISYKIDIPVTEQYKGMLNIDGNNVAIFDDTDSGNKYYNSDSLRPISLDNFESYPMRIVSGMRYYIKDGKLKFWNP
jgi:hypothetical protein